MSSCWFVIPSKRPSAEAIACLEAWRDMGYKTAVMREHADGPVVSDCTIYVDAYRGWAGSVNSLVRFLIPDRDIQWFVTGGDDYWPDPNKRADEIAEECEEHFGGKIGQVLGFAPAMTERASWYRTFGVMQPTGDPWSDSKGRIIERIAGSPWLGREWCRRAYGGKGPLPPYYKHNFADEELQLVAQTLGVFWQRPDIIQEHRHWFHDGKKPAWWDAQCGADFGVARKLFDERKAGGFPGHEPLSL